MKTILAIDPAAERGVSDTGYCYGEFRKNSQFNIIGSGVIHGGFNGFRQELRHGGEFYKRLLTADVVVCEKFVAWEPRADSTPRLIEGVVRYLRPDTILQPASGYKTAVPDRVLKHLGLWSTEGHHSDERSATRHLIMYLKNQLHKPTLKAGWPQ